MNVDRKKYEGIPSVSNHPVAAIRQSVIPLDCHVSDKFLVELFGKKQKGLKMWGGKGESPHWLACRNGISLHIDPGFCRWAYQVAIRNDGFLMTGLDATITTTISPGVIYELDTHSPHEMIRHKANGLFYVCFGCFQGSLALPGSRRRNNCTTHWRPENLLVKSPRHRPNDITLWNNLEECDLIIGANSDSLKRKTRDSLEAIGEFLKRGPFTIAVSWGKDSVVLAHLCRIAAPSMPLNYLFAKNRNPDCESVRDYYLANFPGQKYQQITVDYGTLHSQNLADDEIDKATDKAWYEAINKSQSWCGGRHATGIRADESLGRKIRCHRWGMASKNAIAPLAWWKSQDVFSYLAINKLPVHPAYAMLGGGRWPRDRIRTAEIGDTHGTGGGRREWEQEYYGDILRRIQSGK